MFETITSLHSSSPSVLIKNARATALIPSHIAATFFVTFNKLLPARSCCSAATIKTDRRSHMFISTTSRGRRTASKMLSKDEARRIAVNIAKLPGLLSAAHRSGSKSKTRMR
jgi:hypothetical protein